MAGRTSTRPPPLMLPDLSRPPPPVVSTPQPQPLTDQERQTYILQLKAAAMLAGKGRRRATPGQHGVRRALARR